MKLFKLFIVVTLLCILPENVEYMGARQCDIAKGIRRLLDNKNVLLVVRILVEKGPMKFGDITGGTQLSRSDLNHALQEMKDIGLIVQLESKEYSLTQYCATLLKGLEIITDDFKKNQDGMFLPIRDLDLS